MMRSDTLSNFKLRDRSHTEGLFLLSPHTSFFYLYIFPSQTNPRYPSNSITEYEKIFLFSQTVQSVCIWWGQVGAVFLKIHFMD